MKTYAHDLTHEIQMAQFRRQCRRSRQTFLLVIASCLLAFVLCGLAWCAWILLHRH